jgi:hypothetical protein
MRSPAAKAVFDLQYQERTAEHHVNTSMFLLSFFLNVYALELCMQVIVLGFSFSSYDEAEEPWAVMVIDSFIAVLLVIEVRAHYMSMPSQFWNDKEMIADFVIAVISVFFIGAFVLAKEGVVDVPQELASMMHLFRDATRILRIPMFTRNFTRMMHTMRANKGAIMALDPHTPAPLMRL